MSIITARIKKIKTEFHRLKPATFILNKKRGISFKILILTHYLAEGRRQKDKNLPLLLPLSNKSEIPKTSGCDTASIFYSGGFPTTSAPEDL